MYECVGEEMIDCGIAVKLTLPVWMNSIDTIVEEEEDFGCRVTHNIICPEYAIMLDEVGGNTNQKGDTAVIGVPCGTVLFLVGNSLEQNGNFNMMSVKAKRKIVDDKKRLMMEPTIEPCEIINIVNETWDESFGCTKTNKKAIAERGWGPFNRNLITYPIIRSTITNEEKLKEESAISNIILPMCNNMIQLT